MSVGRTEQKGPQDEHIQGALQQVNSIDGVFGHSVGRYSTLQNGRRATEVLVRDNPRGLAAWRYNRPRADAWGYLLECRSGLEFSVSFIQNQFEENFITTSVDYVFNWARKSAIWPLTFGLACCAIEMIASSTSRFDIARFGAEVFRPSPRQSDLMIVAGPVTLKVAPVLKRIWG